MSSDDPSWWAVYPGVVDEQGNGEIYNVSFIITHEDFSRYDDGYIGDISLVKVSIKLYGK
jgi:hypothetical protein